LGQDNWARGPALPNGVVLDLGRAADCGSRNLHGQRHDCRGRSTGGILRQPETQEEEEVVGEIFAH